MLYVYSQEGGSCQYISRIPTVYMSEDEAGTIRSPSQCAPVPIHGVHSIPVVPVHFPIQSYVMAGNEIEKLEYEPAMSDVSSEFFENEERVMIERSDEEGEIDVENDQIDSRPFMNHIDMNSPGTSRTNTPVSYPGVIMRNPEYLPQEEIKNEGMETEVEAEAFSKMKIEPKLEPEVDLELTPYTPNAELRVIEEHHQYKGDDPDQKDREFQCDFCPKRFRRKEERKRHQNSHLNIRPHKCRICDKTFMRADHRNSHEKTHSKEKEYNCDICRKSFRRADEHKRHMLRQIHLRNVARLNNSKRK